MKRLVFALLALSSCAPVIRQVDQQDLHEMVQNLITYCQYKADDVYMACMDKRVGVPGIPFVYACHMQFHDTLIDCQDAGGAVSDSQKTR